MSRRRGSAKTGGRRRGTPNKATLAIADAFVALGLPAEKISGLSPLEMMLIIAETRFSVGDHHGALIAAQAAAPYVHAKLSSAEVHVTNENERKTLEMIESELFELQAKSASINLNRRTPRVLEGVAEPDQENSPSRAVGA